MPPPLPDAVAFKGITTVYDGLFPVVTVSKGGRARPLKRRQPKWARVQRVDYIQGGTLARVVVYEGRGTGKLKAAVRLLSEKQLENQCDDCIRKHRPSNKRCSATLGIRSACTDQGVLYRWDTKKPAGRWRTDLLQIGGRDKVGVAEFSRV